MSVFISHSSKDKAIANALVEYLEEKGIDCWIAPRNIPIGTNYPSEIIKGIRNAQAMVFIFSENSNNSPDCEIEIERARNYDRHIVPFHISKLNYSESLEYHLSSRQHIEGFPGEPNGYFSEIFNILQRFLGLEQNTNGSKLKSLSNKLNEKKCENQKIVFEKIEKKMQTETSELLRKYTAGTGEGIKEVEVLLNHDPNNVDLIDWLAFMHYSENSLDKAIGLYKRYITIKNDNENAYYYLANCYFKKQMMAEAKKSWSEVVRIKPSSKIAQDARERVDFLASEGY
ncbi:hypothetical protein MASR1M12_31360 [Erysipelotrichia bacterium]